LTFNECDKNESVNPQVKTLG